MSLTLFVIEDYESRLSDEALLVEEFKVLYAPTYNKQPGDTQGRERRRAIAECRYIYHFCDYRSEFSEYEDEERHIEALLAAGLAENYKISDEMQACMNIFLRLQETRMLKTLQTAEKTLDKLRTYYEDIDFNERDSKSGALVHKPKDIMGSIADLGNINKKLGDLRKQVKAELKETESLRGDHEGGFDGAE